MPETEAEVGRSGGHTTVRWLSYSFCQLTLPQGLAVASGCRGSGGGNGRSSDFCNGGGSSDISGKRGKCSSHSDNSSSSSSSSSSVAMVFHDYPTTSFKISIEKEKVVTVGGVSAQHLYTSIVQAGELLDSLPQIAESMQCRQRQKQFFSGPPPLA